VQRLSGWRRGWIVVTALWMVWSASVLLTDGPAEITGTRVPIVEGPWNLMGLVERALVIVWVPILLLATGLIVKQLHQWSVVTNRKA
jgi:hypothetical protein